MLPDYLRITPEQLGAAGPVAVAIVGNQMEDVARHMAQEMFQVVKQAQDAGRAATLIVPVGPVDQFPLLADMINHARADWSDVVLINMDEYLTDDDQWIDMDHPLSFRAYMNRAFYDRIDSALVPRPEHRFFPDPQHPEEIGRLIQQRGGVDACFGGIGINGHIAFNEPPEEDQSMTVEQFAQLPSRCLDLSRETRTINSVTVGGEISIIPRRAVTVGMQEILAATRLRFYCNRPWQQSVVRRVLHGPIQAACPASLLRTHRDARLTLAQYVAQLPEIRLR